MFTCPYRQLHAEVLDLTEQGIEVCAIDGVFCGRAWRNGARQATAQAVW